LDLLHEEIPEIKLDNPLLDIQHGSDLQEMRIVLIGDQNAGKSTFLYTLSDLN
jgi:GTPase SAR1 family protein